MVRTRNESLRTASGLLEQRALEAIRTALVGIDGRLAAQHIGLETSIVDDLGVDSIRFIELTVAIEEALEISELPFQQWHDAEKASERGRRFTVRSLVDVCTRCMQERCDE